jgi:hypothetical protein
MEEHRASAPSDSSSVVAGAIVSAVSARPLISQRYKVRVGAGKAVCKKISYTNTYMERRIFRFRTNCPQVWCSLSLSVCPKAFIACHVELLG